MLSALRVLGGRLLSSLSISLSPSAVLQGFMAKGEYAKAVKFFDKSLRLYELPGVKALKQKAERLERGEGASGSSSSSSNSSSSSSGNTRAATAAAIRDDGSAILRRQNTN